MKECKFVGLDSGSIIPRRRGRGGGGGDGAPGPRGPRPERRARPPVPFPFVFRPNVVNSGISIVVGFPPESQTDETDNTIGCIPTALIFEWRSFQPTCRVSSGFSAKPQLIPKWRERETSIVFYSSSVFYSVDLLCIIISHFRVFLCVFPHSEPLLHQCSMHLHLVVYCAFNC